MFLRLSAIITSLRSIFTPLIMGFLTRCSHEHYLLHGDGTAAKLNYFPTISGCSNYFSLREILHHVPYLFSVMFSLMMNQPLPTLFAHVHRIVFSYTQFKPSKVGMHVIIFPLARSSHNLTSLSFLQHLLYLPVLMPSINPMASRTSRSPISMDTFYLIPP